jgi:dolichol-phosphate mannosyltransferase
LRRSFAFVIAPTDPTQDPEPAANASTGCPPRVSIIVPTYREAENLTALGERIHAAMRQQDYAYELIIVDDDSRDGTDGAVARLAESGVPIRLIIRRAERGLSTAVIAGFDQAAGDILACMDADLSHPPEVLPEMIAALTTGSADFVIGSRYVAGGGTDQAWGFFRWLNSRLATWLARPFTRARDPMAGFFALQRDTYDAAAPLDPVGYKIGLELIVKCACRRVVEIPIQFADRHRGASKLNWREQLNYLRHLTRLARFKLTPRKD